MTPIIRSTVYAALVLAAAPAAHAATLGLETAEAPRVAATGTAAYSASESRFDFGFAFTEAGDSATIELNPTDGTGFLSLDGANTLLFGRTLDYATEGNADGADTIEILFNVAADTLGFGTQALATLTGEFGTEEMIFGATDFSDTGATLTVASVEELAPIPLPAGGLLLLSGLGVFALRRRG